jgi:tetratricopeptide (TPR) repeat protein
LTESLEQEIRALRSLCGSPRDPEGRSFAPLADAYRRAGDFRKAVEVLREGLERHPGSVPGHIVAAQLYLEKGLLEEAEIAARRAVEVDEENTVAWGLLATALEDRGALAQARDARIRLAELEGTGPAAPAPEPVVDVALPAPDEAEPEPAVEVALLAPAAPAPESAVDVALLAPDDAEPEPVVDVAELAPAAPEPEPVVDVAELAPDEAEPEPAVDVALLAPDEPAVIAGTAPGPEPILEMVDLAPDDLPADELPETEPLVTRTMAELYARQGLTERALGVYRQLLQVTPGDAELRRRVQELERSEGGSLPEPEQEAPDADHAWTTASAEQPHEVETPFAWTAPNERDEAEALRPSAGTYFGRMLAWEPRAGGPAEDRPPSEGGA